MKKENSLVLFALKEVRRHFDKEKDLTDEWKERGKSRWKCGKASTDHTRKINRRKCCFTDKCNRVEGEIGGMVRILFLK